MREKMGKIPSLLGMSRDEMLVTFVNVQLATNLSYNLLNMNFKLKPGLYPC